MYDKNHYNIKKKNLYSESRGSSFSSSFQVCYFYVSYLSEEFMLKQILIIT